MHSVLKIIFLGLICMFIRVDIIAQPACVVCCCSDPLEPGFPCGDFEEPPLAPSGGWIDYVAGQSYCGWAVVSGSISIHHGLHNNLGLGNPNGPSQHMDLSGFNAGTVERTLTGLIPGKQYTITLWYAAHNGAGLATGHALINNGDLLDETWSTSVSGAVKWEQLCLAFIADAATALLRFEGSSNNPCCGMLIDDMSMFECDPDTEAPTIVNLPADYYAVQCTQDIPLIPPLVTMDNCDSNPDVTFEEIVNGTPCQMTIERIWQVEDNCDNSTSFQQTIEVHDTEPPVFTSFPQNWVTTCSPTILSEFYSWIQLNGNGAAFDNCDQNVEWEIEFQDEPGPGCSVTLVTFIVRDDCDNTSEAVATFSVVDNSQPVMVVQAHDVTIYCGISVADSLANWLGTWGGAVATDSCGPLEWQHDFSGDSLAPVIEVIFTVTDACGNSTQTTAFFFQMVSGDTLFESFVTCDTTLAGVDTVIMNVEGCQIVTITQFYFEASDTILFLSGTCDPALVGNDTLFFLNQFGCDSLVISQTNLLLSSTKNLQLYTCDPAQAGLDTLHLVNYVGCDSTVFVTTTYTGIYQETNQVFLCGKGIPYSDTVTVISGPCDSLFITDYGYYPLDTIWQMGTTCQPVLAGIFVLVFPDANGCDSTVITDVTLLPSDTTLVEGLTCNPAEEINDIQTLSNQWGCDSTVFTSIMYIGVDTQFVQKTSCDPAQVGVVIQTIPGSFCDTIRVTETTWVAFTESRDTLILCQTSGPASDTLFLTNQSGCDSLAIRDFIYTDISADIEIDPERCAGDADGEITVTQVLGGTMPYQYRLGSGPWQSGTLFSALAPGIYSIEIVDANGCALLLSGQAIAAGSTLTLDAGPDQEASVGDLINVSVQSNFALQQVQWLAKDGLTCPTCPTSLLGPLTESQTVQVNGWSVDGCQGTDQMNIVVKSRVKIFIPNSFSPNDDGINDFFTVYSDEDDIVVRNLAIYDRWGNALFSQGDLPVNDPSAGWDGRFRGDRLDPGVYVYVVEIEFPDGSLHLLKGDIAIVR